MAFKYKGVFASVGGLVCKKILLSSVLSLHIGVSQPVVSDFLVVSKNSSSDVLSSNVTGSSGSGEGTPFHPSQLSILEV